MENKIELNKKTTIYDCIIIGAGISGLSFAHYIEKTKQKILVLEKNSKAGGQITTYQPTSNPGFWTELGAHSCYNSYTSLLSIVKDLKKEDIIQPTEKRSYIIHVSGKIKSIFSQVRKLPIILNFFKIFSTKRDSKTVKEYFEPIVGKSNYTPLFSNAFRAVLCQNADNYPAEIFMKKRKERMEEYPRKLTFKKGISSFIDTIIQQHNIPIEYNTEIKNISHSDRIFILESNNGKMYYTRNIAIAIDPANASKLLYSIEKYISGLLSTIPLSESESRTIIISKEKISLNEIAGIIPMDDEFYSVVSRDVVSHSNLRGFTFHFKKGKSTEEEQIKIICKTLGIKKEDIADQSYATHILPSLRIEHLNMGKKIEAARQEKHIYFLGNYYYGLSLEDCVQRSAIEAKRYEENLT